MIERGVDILFSLGPPGAAIVALLWSNWQMFRRYEDEKDSRLKDAKLHAGELAQIAASSKESIDTLTRIIESSERTRR